VFPREDRRDENDDGSADAYVYLSETTPWPRGDGVALLERVPAFMKESTAQGAERIRPDSRDDLPQSIFVNTQGQIVPEGEGVTAALIRRNFLFCLEPSCGIAYTKNQRSERTKLATLGVDNRSTATTILAVRSLIELQADRELRADARKLLSFTDNRQDASLQAGHFNDFAQVALLRSALHKATVQKGSKGLSHGELSRSVFDAMQLQFNEYAADSEVRGPARSATNDALRRVIDYYLYRDLQRGWRVTAPNLEDCGMLTFDYEGLEGEDSLLGETAVWDSGFNIQADGAEQFIEAPVPLRFSTPELRRELLHTLLDVLRRSLAIKVDVLDPQKQLDLVEQTKPRLLEDTVWYLEDARELVKSAVAFPRPKQQDRMGFFVSSYGGYGRYLKRSLITYVPQGQAFGRAEVDQTIRFLFLALKRYGIVEQVRSGEVPGYQINADALRWLPSDGIIRPVDRTRLLEAGAATGYAPFASSPLTGCLESQTASLGMRTFSDGTCCIQCWTVCKYRGQRATRGFTASGIQPVASSILRPGISSLLRSFWATAGMRQPRTSTLTLFLEKSVRRRSLLRRQFSEVVLVCSQMRTQKGLKL
jgi:hypothetical protein